MSKSHNFCVLTLDSRLGKRQGCGAKETQNEVSKHNFDGSWTVCSGRMRYVYTGTDRYAYSTNPDTRACG